MKSLLFKLLSLCALRAVLATELHLNSITEQKSLVQAVVMAEAEGALKVPGHNNATYGPVPKTEQLLEIELLEIAPSTIPV
jgi:hypothetical protein